MNEFDLNNRVSVVTGGAQGFGFAITERFIQSGAKVIIWDIDKEAAEIKHHIDEMSKIYANGKSLHDLLSSMEDKLRGFKKELDKA